MIRHIALFTFNDDVSPDQVDDLADALRALPSTIESIRSYGCGRDLEAIEGTWDFAVIGDFDDLDAYRAYANHPDHVAVVEHHVKPILHTMARVQIEVD